MRTKKHLRSVRVSEQVSETGRGQISGRKVKRGTRNESRLRLQQDRKYEQLKFEEGRRKADRMKGERIVPRTTVTTEFYL